MSDLQHVVCFEHGADTGRGNLLGIQPTLTTADYAAEACLFARLDEYLSDAGRRGWLNARTVAVFPEYIGTWLVAAGGNAALRRAQSLSLARRALALSRVFAFATGLLAARERDRTAASLFRLKAASMARSYQAVFSALARKHGATIVAGSIVLPAPRVVEGALVAGRGPLYNATVVYGPDGAAHQTLVRKAYPVAHELRFVTPAPVSELPVFNTPAGKLGVLICADAWYPAAYERLRAQGAQLIAVPSYIETDGAWDRPWLGYSGADAPPDVDARDVGVLTEGQAWRRYALAGRMASAGARYGVNVFLRGALWDLGTDGRSVMMQVSTLCIKDGAITEATTDGAALLNLWL